ncbi:uncharacterized protein [Argopecten irradians]|uniref:uncharacterized protein isoform X2 n=1 Tax=Argopecten irradians TaxID=31199 RepID=UPI0037176498
MGVNRWKTIVTEMNPRMIQLYQNPGRWSVLALCIHALNLLFHVIAYCSDQWATCTYQNSHTWFGLWRGCWIDDITKETKCSTSIFKQSSFNADTGWHGGAQVLMTISLLLMLFTEVVLIGYACVLKLEPHKPRMTGALVGMLIPEVCVTAIVMLMVGTEVSNLEEGHLSWGYGIKFVTIFLGIATLVLVYMDKGKLFFGSKSDLVNHSEKTSEKNDFDNPGYYDNMKGFSEPELTLPYIGLGNLERGSSRSQSCSDILTLSTEVSFSQTSQSLSSRGRLGVSADDIAKTSQVTNFQEFKRTLQNGTGSKKNRDNSKDSITSKTKSVNMNPDPIDVHVITVPGNGPRNKRLSSSSSIESDV